MMMLYLFIAIETGFIVLIGLFVMASKVRMSHLQEMALIEKLSPEQVADLIKSGEIDLYPYRTRFSPSGQVL